MVVVLVCTYCGIRSDSKLTLHRFPTDIARCNEWARLINRLDLIGKPEYMCHELQRLCSDHFGPEDFDESGSLKDDAVPSIVDCYEGHVDEIQDDKKPRTVNDEEKEPDAVKDGEAVKDVKDDGVDVKDDGEETTNEASLAKGEAVAGHKRLSAILRDEQDATTEETSYYHLVRLMEIRARPNGHAVREPRDPRSG
ncbi:Zinc finger, C2CH-type [Cinara cedri]|uniref:Zinc finger, C2CH-type n=1 Tax=Cinara cedri TaxID=506608 RepID=A0A5E4MQB3_9HEMI|nr:Zinc finger, C2CH-type [Cinara cedri]